MSFFTNAMNRVSGVGAKAGSFIKSAPGAVQNGTANAYRRHALANRQSFGTAARLATGAMTVIIESASVATINNAETQQAATVVVTSLGRQAATAKIDVYPNPAVDVVNVTCDADVKSVSVKNLLGIALKTTSEKSVDLSDLSNGIYVVEVETVTGAVGVEKIVVKK